jgi:23S rRNA (adenine2503-C2)-methyltransferase
MTENKNKIYALDLTHDEWVSWLAKELNQPKFRAGQICQWLWQKHTFDADEMTNLSLPLRELLKERVDFSAPILITEQRSKLDGTRKYLWQLRDGETIESVLLKQGDRLTACISTQVGCPLQCSFCATGLSGFVRNLSSGEIAGQFLAMEKIVEREINNVVYMGMGEPFLNTDNVLLSVRMLNDEQLRNLGIRHITISTSGIVPGIEALADSGLGVRLAISLHAAEDELRSKLMPVNQTYPLAELREAMTGYQEQTGDRLTIEYALFGGVNDSVEQARQLIRFLKGIHVFVNLIPYNSVDGRYEKPQPEDVLRFRSVLETAGFECELRQEQGADIDAACGQLRRKTAAGEDLELAPGPKMRAERESKEERRPVSKFQAARGRTNDDRKFGSRPAKPQHTEGADEEQPGRSYGKPARDEGPQREHRPYRSGSDERRPRGEARADERHYGRRESGDGSRPYEGRPHREEERREEHGRGGFRGGENRGFRKETDDRKTRPQKAKFSSHKQDEDRIFMGAHADKQDFGGRGSDERRDGEGFRSGRRPSAKMARPPKERYRSGKMKEARPTYRGQNSEAEAEHRGYKPRAPRMPGALREEDENPRREFRGGRPHEEHSHFGAERGERKYQKREGGYAPRGEKPARGGAPRKSYGKAPRKNAAKARKDAGK